MLVDAANCYKKVSPEKAVKCLEQTIEIYVDMGRFTTAAKHHISIAEIYESDLVDFGKTVDHYQIAADYYSGEESKASANRCLLKVAQYSALNGKFQKVSVGDQYQSILTQTFFRRRLKSMSRWATRALNRLC